MVIKAKRDSKSKFARKGLSLALATTIATAPSMAHAWKPSTHVTLAEIALQDALDDGQVTIMRIDPRTGVVLGELGEYPVDPRILAALRAAPDRFRAGVIGPDAYPDILTGQQIIHPHVAKNAAGQSTGSDAWLEHLWNRSYGDPAVSGEVRAFVSGYLVHAAGDSFAHTYVNHYSGGEFTIKPVANAVRHLVLESYIDKRAPVGPANLPVSIEGVESFIYRETINARSGTTLEQRLLIAGEGTRPLSIPLVFSSLRNRLMLETARYKAELSTRRGLARIWFQMAHGIAAKYRRHWIDDIDKGLEAWPAVSAEVSAAVLYYPGHLDTNRAEAALDRYAKKHLWSMAGAPDCAVAIVYAPSEIADAILPEQIKHQLKAIAKAPFEAMLKATTSMNSDEWKDYMVNPELHFDKVMSDTGQQPTAHAISLADFNHDQIDIADDGYNYPEQRWTLDAFAPAFNTVQLTKLSFLAPDQLRAVELALGNDAQSPPSSNVMLGWIGSLDASSEWRAEVDGSGEARFARPALFNQLFRPHFAAP